MACSYSTSKLVDGYKRAFVDSTVVADPLFSPQLLTNRGGEKVLTAIEKEMKGCDDLFISVAFITMGGIAPLLGTLKDLEKKGVKGRILTLDVRVFKTGENDVGFHTKGYMFHLSI